MELPTLESFATIAKAVRNPLPQTGRARLDSIGAARKFRRAVGRTRSREREVPYDVSVTCSISSPLLGLPGERGHKRKEANPRCATAAEASLEFERKRRKRYPPAPRGDHAAWLARERHPAIDSRSRREAPGEAQLVIARAYGSSWPRIVRYLPTSIASITLTWSISHAGLRRNARWCLSSIASAVHRGAAARGVRAAIILRDAREEISRLRYRRPHGCRWRAARVSHAGTCYSSARAWFDHRADKWYVTPSRRCQRSRM